ncbi:MAG: hypothetical protein AAFO91_09940 [Bacteroidota bacterium]
MDAPEIVEVPNDPPAIETLALSPDARASLMINLIAEITVTGIAEDQHDLSLFFLTFQPAAIAALQRLVPALVDVSPTLIYAQTFLGLASASERTRSEATKARVVAAIDARGDDFLRGLERYRLSVDPIVEDDEKLMALLNFFSFGHTVFQFTLLQTAALNNLTAEYLKIIPVINRINDNSNKLILSKISKQDGYSFASQVQDAIDELSRACVKYYGLAPPVFHQRSYVDVRAAFIDSPLVDVPHDFEQLVTFKNNDTLFNVRLTDCRDPANFGSLDGFKKQLADFLLNLSRHRDDPTVSVSKKLENRAEAARACVERVKTALGADDPNLISLRCLNEELSDLNRFYTEQSSYVKLAEPSFAISSIEMTELRERLLTKIDTAQSVKAQKDDEYKILNRAFLESKTLPKINVKSWLQDS